MDVIMMDEIERFEEANKRVYVLGEELLGRSVIVKKNILGFFYDEGEIDEMVCKVIGYDRDSFKVTHEDLTGKTEEVENYILYKDPLEEDGDD